MATLDVQAYQARSYTGAAPCWQLVLDVYAEQLQVDPLRVGTVTDSLRHAARAYDLELLKEPGGMQPVVEPQELAVVLLWPTAKRRDPHCGIYHAGSVLHATREYGVLFQELGTLRDSYPVIEFWASAT